MTQKMTSTLTVPASGVYIEAGTVAESLPCEALQSVPASMAAIDPTEEMDFSSA
jgi:hypothetical protein